MKLTLSKLKIHKDMSEETIAFTADIMLDGKLVGHVANKGCGGCNNTYWRDHAKGQLIENWAEAQTVIIPAGDCYEAFELEHEKLDHFIGEIIQNGGMSAYNIVKDKPKPTKRVFDLDKAIAAHAKKKGQESFIQYFKDCVKAGNHVFASKAKATEYFDDIVSDAEPAENIPPEEASDNEHVAEMALEPEPA
jgi:hypothetical protein